MMKTLRQIGETLAILVLLLAIPVTIERVTSSEYLTTTPEIPSASAQSSEVLGASVVVSQTTDQNISSMIFSWEMMFVAGLLLISFFIFFKYKLNKDQ